MFRLFKKEPVNPPVALARPATEPNKLFNYVAQPRHAPYVTTNPILSQLNQKNEFTAICQKPFNPLASQTDLKIVTMTTSDGLTLTLSNVRAPFNQNNIAKSFKYDITASSGFQTVEAVNEKGYELIKDESPTPTHDVIRLFPSRFLFNRTTHDISIVPTKLTIFNTEVPISLDKVSFSKLSFQDSLIFGFNHDITIAKNNPMFIVLHHYGMPMIRHKSNFTSKDFYLMSLVATSNFTLPNDQQEKVPMLFTESHFQPAQLALTELLAQIEALTISNPYGVITTDVIKPIREYLVDQTAFTFVNDDAITRPQYLQVTALIKENAQAFNKLLDVIATTAEPLSAQIVTETVNKLTQLAEILHTTYQDFWQNWADEINNTPSETEQTLSQLLEDL